MSNLKPCPFCGMPAISREKFRDCSCSDPTCAGYQSWVSDESWNKRTVEDSLRSKLEQAEAELEAVMPVVEAVLSLRRKQIHGVFRTATYSYDSLEYEDLEDAIKKFRKGGSDG